VASPSRAGARRAAKRHIGDAAVAKMKGARTVSEREGEFKGIMAGAIYREIGARDFYRKIADGIRRPEGKQKFETLSNDEDGHRRKLESWYLKFFGAAFVPDRKGLQDAEIKGVTVSDKTGAMAALDIAIKAEMKAEEFYSAQAQQVTDPQFKELLTRLAGEEHGHYEFLLAERSSLAGGFYWFDIDSASFLED
jgi:rubrerythrin